MAILVSSGERRRAVIFVAKGLHPDSGQEGVEAGIHAYTVRIGIIVPPESTENSYALLGGNGAFLHKNLREAVTNRKDAKARICCIFHL